MSIRTERVARLLQREIAGVLQTAFSERIPCMYTVTNVRVTRDLGIAYVDVSIYEQDIEERRAAFRHFTDLTAEIRSALARRIRHQLRAVPDIRFFLDEAMHESKRMDEIFEKIRAEREHREAGLQ
ncbi:MAG: 30S ribosome-binding factor RbfA [Bacteroidetes bacterium SB0662_bin_6]|nr:30S ribosome-binding factor RbfA [Bacteroidetes bacterium SB0668_bin_1]MYE04906.1 30S ribosome-binding factor RbfA [Bacteroidetes bacterium SB0662_bin_6]